MAARGWGEGGIPSGDGVSFRSDENVLELASGDGCTAF